MAANINDKLTQVEDGGAPIVTTVSSARSQGGSSLSCVALTNWPTATSVHFITYQKKTDGTIDNDTIVAWKGIVSGTTIGSLTLQNGTDTGNSVGDFVAMTPTSAWAEGIYDWGSTEHGVDGTHKSELITSRTTITSTATDDTALVTDASDSNNLKEVSLANLLPDKSVTPEKLATFNAAILGRPSGQNLTTTFTNVDFGESVYDPNSWADTSDDSITVSGAGLYMIYFSGYTTDSGDGEDMLVRPTFDGSETLPSGFNFTGDAQHRWGGITASTNEVTGFWIFPLSAGTVLRIQVSNASGDSNSIQNCLFHVVQLGNS